MVHSPPRQRQHLTLRSIPPLDGGGDSPSRPDRRPPPSLQKERKKKKETQEDWESNPGPRQVLKRMSSMTTPAHALPN